MKYSKDKWVEWCAASSAFFIGCIYGSFVDFKYQKEIYEILRNTSAIIFGVVGAWYAVITPIYLGNENKKSKEATYASRLLNNLLVPIKYAVYILCVTIIFQLLYPISSLVSLGGFMKMALKAISFGVICALSVMMLFTLIRSLVPNDFVQIDMEIKDEKAKYEERLKSQNRNG